MARATTPGDAGSAPSLNQARNPNATAQATLNLRKPLVGRDRRRSSAAAPYEPRASPVSRVQLTKARFWAICVAGTSRV